jgi:hypothetical protein
MSNLDMHQVRQGDRDTQSEHHVWNLCWVDVMTGRDVASVLRDRGPKAFRSNMGDAQFPKYFWQPSNVVKYDGKTNSSVWLEDYRLACRAGRANNDLLIIQFLPIYLDDLTRA